MGSKPIIAGLCGLSGSGKSTVSDYLVAKHGFVAVSLAEPLKRMVQDIFGFTDRQLFGPSIAREEALTGQFWPDGTPITARTACERVGSSVTNVYPDAFLAPAIRKASQHASRIQRVVVPDVRYYRTVREMPALREIGALLVKRATCAPASSSHPSNIEHLELPDSYFDAVLPQYASKAELYERVDALVREWTR